MRGALATALVLIVAAAMASGGCLRGRAKHERNVSANNVVAREELDEMTHIHWLDIHLDEGDELYDRYEVRFDLPPDEHPPTR